MDVRQLVNDGPFTAFQKRVVAVTLILSVVDGFDILVISFAIPDVSADWGLSGSQIGFLLSSGLIGMAAGSALLAPFADRIGRRPLTIGCLALATLGMIAATSAPNAELLAACRLVTGLGVGGMAASLPVIVTEYSPQRRRGTAMAVYTIGLPLGGVLCGLIAFFVIDAFGWRALFVAGALLTILALVLVALTLPESLAYLLTRQPEGALARTNGLLLQMGHAELKELPEKAVPSVTRSVGSSIFRGSNGRRTALLWISFFTVMAAFYFAQSWTPQLLRQADGGLQQGISSGLLLNVGGVVAIALYGLLALALSNRILTAASLLLMVPAFLAMTPAMGNSTAMFSVAAAIGLTANAAVTGLYALAPGLYPPEVRTTAVGWAVSAGRIGAISAPILIGFLVDRAWAPGDLFSLFAVPTIIAAAAVSAMTRRPSPQAGGRH